MLNYHIITSLMGLKVSKLKAAHPSDCITKRLHQRRYYLWHSLKESRESHLLACHHINNTFGSSPKKKPNNVHLHKMPVSSLWLALFLLAPPSKPNNLQVIDVTTRTVTLAWAPPTTTGGADLMGKFTTASIITLVIRWSFTFVQFSILHSVQSLSFVSWMFTHFFYTLYSSFLCPPPLMKCNFS